MCVCLRGSWSPEISPRLTAQLGYSSDSYRYVQAPPICEYKCVIGVRHIQMHEAFVQAHADAHADTYRCTCKCTHRQMHTDIHTMLTDA